MSSHFGCRSCSFPVLGWDSTSPRIGRVALHSRCLIGPSDAASPVTWAGCSRCAYFVVCVHCPVVVEPWLLSAYHWKGLDWPPLLLGKFASWTDCGYSRVTAFQGTIPQIRTYFSRALVPSLSSPWVCHSWRCLGCNMVWSEAVREVHYLCSLLGGTRSAAACTLPGTTQHKLQSDLQMTATCARLADALERPNCKQRPAAACAWPGTT